MKYIGIALIYLGFFSLIGMCCFLFDSPWPLLGLLLMPEFSEKTNNSK